LGGLIPLSDASRRPVRLPVVTAFIIVVNVFVFLLELMRGDAFVMQWSAIPAQITSGHHWITIFTAMFMHGSWSHIIGNMIFLWAFGPEIEDAMGRGRYLLFYLAGGLVAMLAQILADLHSTVPNLGASGAIDAVMGGFISRPRSLKPAWLSGRRPSAQWYLRSASKMGRSLIDAYLDTISPS